MTPIFAESVMLMNPIKPVIFLVLVGAWGWIVSRLDKDMEYFFLKRSMWNGILLASGLVGFGLMLLIPIFWISIPLTLLITIGAVIGYVYYRNTEVAEDERWPLHPMLFIEAINKKREETAKDKQRQRAKIFLMDPKDDHVHDVPVGDTPQARAHDLLTRVMDYALPRAADQIEMAANAEKAVLAVRIDGVRFPMNDLGVEPAGAMEFLEYLKGAAGLDLADRRKKQSGFTKIDAGDLGRHELAVTTMGSTKNVQMMVSIDPRAQNSIPFKQLGFLESQREQLDELLATKGQIVIVASPPNSGQTSTLYTLLQRHDPYTQSVWTLEEKVPVELEGVTHEILDPELTPEQLKQKVEVVFRRDPQVLFYGKTPDANVAGIIARYADEVRVYIGMQADDSVEALRKWVKLVGDPKLATRNLGAIISQRLIRRVCKTCRQPYTPDAAAMKKLNLPADRVTTLYNASGQVVINKKEEPCPDCHGLAYRGRIGVFEVVQFPEELKTQLAAKPSDMRAVLRGHKVLWMQEAALTKVLEGKTDIKEIKRSFAEKSEGRKRAAKPAASPQPKPAPKSPSKSASGT